MEQRFRNGNGPYIQLAQNRGQDVSFYEVLEEYAMLDQGALKALEVAKFILLVDKRFNLLADNRLCRSWKRSYKKPIMMSKC